MSDALRVETGNASSYPFVHAQEPEHIPIRALLDFSPPDSHLLSKKPSPPHPPTNLAGYTVSTHIIPGSYLRHTPLITPPPPPSGSNKAERLASAKKTVDQLRQARLQTWKGTFGSSRQAIFWNCVNRYVPKKKKEGGITLLLANAISLPKEIWEPVLEHLLDSELIEEVWTWETAQHGDSALLNREQESAVYDWADNSNDLLNFLVHYLPSRFQRDPLPTHLNRVPESESISRRAHGFKNRTLAAVGHSFNGSTVALTAIRYPILFSSLVLGDPSTIPYQASSGLYETESGAAFIWNAIRRRMEWSSRDEALRYLMSSPFYASWHPSILRIYVERGIVADERDGRAYVRATASIVQEAAYGMDTVSAKELFQQIKDLDERIPILWVMPGTRVGNPISDESVARALVWRRSANAANVIVPHASHMIPQEAPKDFALLIANFLEDKHGALSGRPKKTKL